MDAIGDARGAWSSLVKNFISGKGEGGTEVGGAGVGGEEERGQRKQTNE